MARVRSDDLTRWDGFVQRAVDQAALVLDDMTQTLADGVADRIMARYGFEAIAESQPPPIGELILGIGENILISLMVFARNAGALRANSLTRVPVPIFLSRQALEHRFGGSKPT